MNILAFPGQEILIIREDGIDKKYLVLTMDQLFEIRAKEPHRLRKIDDNWCVRVEHLH